MATAQQMSDSADIAHVNTDRLVSQTKWDGGL